MLVANEVCGWVECRISRFLPTYIYLPINVFYLSRIEDATFKNCALQYRKHMYGIDYSRTFICDGMCLYFDVHLKDITFENKTKQKRKMENEQLSTVFQFFKSKSIFRFCECSKNKKTRISFVFLHRNTYQQTISNEYLI